MARILFRCTGGRQSGPPHVRAPLHTVACACDCDFYGWAVKAAESPAGACVSGGGSRGWVDWHEFSPPTANVRCVRRNHRPICFSPGEDLESGFYFVAKIGSSRVWWPCSCRQSMVVAFSPSAEEGGEGRNFSCW
jgi:hypothetical protein